MTQKPCPWDDCLYPDCARADFCGLTDESRRQALELLEREARGEASKMADQSGSDSTWRATARTLIEVGKCLEQIEGDIRRIGGSAAYSERQARWAAQEMLRSARAMVRHLDRLVSSVPVEDTDPGTGELKREARGDHDRDPP